MFTWLRLERFKSFKDAELKLGPFTVLIGANASGKSNIRDAFRFLHGIARGYSLADIIGEKYGEGGERVWTGIRGGTREITLSGSRSFALTADFRVPARWEVKQDEIRYRIEVEINRGKSTSQVVAEELGERGAYHYFKSTSKKNGCLTFEFVPHADMLPAPGKKKNNTHATLYSIPSQFTFLATFVAEFPFIATWDENQSDCFIENQLDFVHRMSDLRSMRFFDWSLDALRQPSMPGQEVLSDNGRNLSSVLLAICENAQSKRDLLSWVHELTPMDLIDLEFPADPAGRVLATLVERNKQKTTLGSASDGTLRFLAFLASFLGPETPSFYFFEELENGIHPTRLNILVDLIENQVKNKNTQVVATTHSPQLLSRLSNGALEHASLVYRVPEEPDARIIPVLEMPHAKRLIKKQKLSHLLASGWFETSAQFMQPDPDDGDVLENSKPNKSASPSA